MANKLTSAANAAAAGDTQDAIDQLTSLLKKVDSQPKPKDWMLETGEKDQIRSEIEFIVSLLEFP